MRYLCHLTQNYSIKVLLQLFGSPIKHQGCVEKTRCFVYVITNHDESWRIINTWWLLVAHMRSSALHWETMGEECIPHAQNTTLFMTCKVNESHNWFTPVLLSWLEYDFVFLFRSRKQYNIKCQVSRRNCKGWWRWECFSWLIMYRCSQETLIIN